MYDDTPIVSFRAILDTGCAYGFYITTALWERIGAPLLWDLISETLGLGLGFIWNATIKYHGPDWLFLYERDAGTSFFA
jgi:hypothetical protein